jgi:16S rRNA (cytosine1402-N4)-methyltransferase
MILASPFHLPVLLPEVITDIGIKEEKIYIDATLGGGGYTFEILKKRGKVIAIDADKDAINYVKDRVKKLIQSDELDRDAEERIYYVHGNFSDIEKISNNLGQAEIYGIIFDLGISTYQIEKSGRGFAYTKNEYLDMRFDRNLEKTAADIINSYSKNNLYEIFSKYSEELNSWPIADAVFRSRTLKGPILYAGQLIEIINRVVSDIAGGKKEIEINDQKNKTRARIFQALRIEVNDELESLKKGLCGAVNILGSGVLTYHSLEDRIVKLLFRKLSYEGKISIIHKKPLIASREETRNNSSARSAKLRVVEKK